MYKLFGVISNFYLRFGNITQLFLNVFRTSDKFDSTNDFNEITAREAERLKADNITEAMNKLKELRGYVKSKVIVSNSATETEVTKQFNKASGNDSTFVGYSLADVPLPKGIQVAADVTELVEQTATPVVRTHEACTSAKIDLMDRDVKRKKEMLKRKWEEDEEDELSRLRYITAKIIYMLQFADFLLV